MPLNYEVDNKLKALAPVVDEHAEWFGRVVKAVFYPEIKSENVDPPASFSFWARETSQDDFIERVTLERVVKLHAELHQSARDMIASVQAAGNKPDFKKYDDFANLYDDFLYQLRRLEHDAVQADTGIDVATGLRSKKAMMVDLEREMERRARRGKPFCLTLARIDNYDQIKTLVTEERHREIVATVSRLIKKCIRSFDDAYRSGEGEFIMSLKHSDLSGGTAAINRLRKFLDEERITIEGSDRRPFLLTMSTCVAEPLPGDTIDDLLANMRNDLQRFNAGTGEATLEYFEQSALSRYVNDIEQK